MPREDHHSQEPDSVSNVSASPLRNSMPPPNDPQLSLPPLPIPDIPTMVSRLIHSARPFLTPAEIDDLSKALTHIFLDPKSIPDANSPYQTIIQPLLTGLKSSAQENKYENWAITLFKNTLLQTRFPVANTVRVETVVDIPGERRGREGKTIRALAVWGTECVWGERECGGLLQWQMEGYWGMFREPDTQGKDGMRKVEGRPGHVVVWWKGEGYVVTVVGEDGRVLSEEDIQEQIEEVKKSFTDEGFKLAAFSWRNNRPTWNTGREALRAIPENNESFGLLYSSLFSVALEDYDAPGELADLLDDIRIGRTSENRFPDQTLQAVFYRDGTVGFAFDHTPADCGPAIELSQAIVDFVKNDNFPKSTTKASPPKHIPFKQAGDLEVPEKYTEPLPREVDTFEIEFPESISKTLTSHRLVDPIICLAFQEALLHHTSLSRVDPIFQPVWIRAFRGGRCDPFCPVTPESLDFLKLLFEQKKSADEVFQRLSDFLAERRRLIRERMDGKAANYFQQGFLHPAFAFAADPSSEVPEEYKPSLQTIVSVFSRIAGVASALVEDASSVQFTGFTTKYSELRAGLSNIYLPDQLVIFYLWRENTLVLTASATGRYKGEELKRVMRGYQMAVRELVPLAEKYVAWRDEGHGSLGTVEVAR